MRGKWDSYDKKDDGMGAIHTAMTRRTTAGGGHSHHGGGAPDRTWRWMEDGRKCGGVANRRRIRCWRCRGRPGYWYTCAWCRWRFCPGCICQHWCGWHYRSMRDSADKQHDWWRDSWWSGYGQWAEGDESWRGTFWSWDHEVQTWVPFCFNDTTAV